MQCPQCQVTLPADARFCAACGVAIPNAPGPAATSASSKGIIAVVIGAGALLLVMMVGIIAAIAIPNFLNAVDRGKQKRTMADLRSLATVIEMYAGDHGVYPAAESMSSLRRVLEPDYSQALPNRDGWGHEIQVFSTDAGYALISPGKDGVLDADDRCEQGATSEFVADICFADGNFTQWPEGVQR